MHTIYVHDNIRAMTIVVVCVFLQAEVPSHEAASNDIQFPLEVTGGHMRPVVVLKRLDVTR